MPLKGRASRKNANMEFYGFGYFFKAEKLALIFDSSSLHQCHRKLSPMLSCDAFCLTNNWARLSSVGDLDGSGKSPLAFLAGGDFSLRTAGKLLFSITNALEGRRVGTVVRWPLWWFWCWAVAKAAFGAAPWERARLLKLSIQDDGELLELMASFSRSCCSASDA